MTEGTGRAWESDPLALIGRAATLSTVGSLLARAPRTAVVLGFPGQGKSVLLEAIGRRWASSGGTVVSIGSRGGPPTSPSATVELTQVPPTAGDLLERLGRRHRVLVVLDDVPGVDARSTAVLRQAVTSVADREVSVLYAGRHTPPPGVDERVCVHLGPLDDRQAIELLHRAGIAVNAFVRADLLERAAGNPRALLELGRFAQAEGPWAVRVPDVLSTVEAHVASDLVALPASTRRVLLLAAAGGDDLGRLLRVLDESELLAALAPAETQRLIRVTDRRVLFRHRLARTAVYGAATIAERVTAHRALAAAFADDPDVQLRHLAAATLAPDEGLAAALMESASGADRRWALTEAARLRAQAAQLTPDRDRRAERLLDALATVLPTGNLAWLDELATRLRNDATSASARSRADHFRAYALAHTFQQDAARMTLIEALEGLLTVAKDDGWEALSTLATVVYQTGRGTEALASWFDLYRRRTPVRQVPMVRLIEASQAWIGAVIDPDDRRAELFRLVRSEPSADPFLPAEAVATISGSLGAAAWLLQESSVARRHLRCAVDLMGRARIPGQLARATMTLAQVDFDLAEYDAADRGARHLVVLGATEQLPHLRVIGLELQARVAAVRGEIERAAGLVDEVLRELGTGQMRALAADLRRTQAFVCLARHDAAGCLESLRSLYDRNGLPVHRHVSDRALADLVSAAVRVGRSQDVRIVVAAAHARMRDPGRRQRLVLARCDALLAGDDAEQYHQRAVGSTDADEWPFDLANAHLEYGGWLRRHHRPSDARSHLRTALDHFEQLGTRPWADLARSELRASGVLLGNRAPTTWEVLTEQERQVVRLAAAGLTNREIGASLYLSPRTVGAHLYNAFPKLGVTARAQLRDVVERRAAAD